MEDKDLIKVVDFIQGYYSRQLNKAEIKALSDELKGFTFEEFESEIKLPLLKKVEYFNVANLHKIVEDTKDLRLLKKQLGIKSFDELCEN